VLRSIRVGSAVAGAALLALGCAPAGAARRPVAPKPVAQGRAVMLAGAGKAAGLHLRLTVAKGAVESELQNQSDVDYSQYAPSGKEFVVVTLKLAVRGKAVPAKDLVLDLMAGKARYPVNAAAGVALGRDTYPSTLKPGKVLTESFAFIVPTGAKGFVLDAGLGKGKAVALAVKA